MLVFGQLLANMRDDRCQVELSTFVQLDDGMNPLTQISAR